MQKKGFLIVISGPTSIGKSSLVLKLATHFQCPIISTDSRQLYKEMSIGTAKPSKMELAETKHYFVDSHSIHDDMNAAKFEVEGNQIINSVLQSKPLALATGGTGMYINSLCDGLDAFPEVPKAVLQHYESLLNEKGISELQAELKRVDPKYYELVDLDNSRRLIRALSVIRASGVAYSEFLNQPKKERAYNPIYILLEMPRDQLYTRINNRVDQMIKNGLIEEAKGLFSLRNLKSLDTVGYRELFQYFDENIDLEEAIRLIKRNTRRYAKRQMTWFRKEAKWNRFQSKDYEGILKFIEKNIK